MDRLPTWVPTTDRPFVADSHAAAWLVALALLPFGLDAYWDNPRIGLTTWEPSSLMGVNYHVYHVAAEAAMAGENFYTVHPPGQPAYHYLYPPASVIAWYPFTAVGWTTGFALLTLLTVLAGLASAWLLVEYVEEFGPALGWVDVAIVTAAFVLSTHSFGSIYFGNVNVLLAVAIVAGFWALTVDRDGLAGVSFAGAASVKVFPALVGLWLLREKEWKATAVALATGIAGLVAGVALYGFDRTWYYFTVVPGERSRTAQFVGGYPVDAFPYVTVQRPLSHLLWSVWPAATYTHLVVLSVVVCGVVLAYFYLDVSGEHERLMAVFATMVVTVLVFPALRWYVVLVYLPLFALAYVWREGPGRLAFVAGALLFAVGETPTEVAAYAGSLPGPLADPAVALASTVSPQTAGLTVALAGCVWYKTRTNGVLADGVSLRGTALFRERRP